MSTPSIERCPRCGSPYMSAMLPTETPATRYCYTCATALANAQRSAAPMSAAAADDLELQPPNETSSGSSRRAQLPQPTSSRRFSPARPPTAAPNVRPKSRILSPVAVTPLMPAPDNAIDQSATITNARIQLPSHRSNRRVFAPPADDVEVPAKPAFPMRMAIGAAACVALALIAVFALRGSKAPPPIETPIAVATPQPASVAKATPVVTPKPTTASSAPISKNAGPKTTSAKELEARIGLASPGVADTREASSTPGPNAEPKPAALDVNDILKKSNSKHSAAAIEEEELTATKIGTPKSANALDVAANPPVIAPNPNAGPAPATPAAGDPAAVAKVDDPDKDLDKDGNPKKHRSLIDNLSAEPEKAVKHEMDKKENPFAIKVVPVTSVEPTIMPIDLDKIAGNDRFLTDQVVAFLPNWRVRDANYNGSKINFDHQGRNNVISLNPMNDTLPAKLIATIEIPKGFANSHPTLHFEISTAPRKEWGFGVKANGVDLIPKTPVKLPKETPWQDIAVDLTTLVDKHFDVQIEVSALKKYPKGNPPETGYIRNVRLEWKKK